MNGRGGTVGPNLTYIGDQSPEQYDYSRINGVKTAFAWHLAHLQRSQSGGPHDGDAELWLQLERCAIARDADGQLAKDRPARRIHSGRKGWRCSITRRTRKRETDGEWRGRLFRQEELLYLPRREHAGDRIRHEDRSGPFRCGGGCAGAFWPHTRRFSRGANRDDGRGALHANPPDTRRARRGRQQTEDSLQPQA
ncbi:MAG: hypothetical protein LC114_17105 [Bryobacterales bacterium]|nr:hypothetical protein [Bryobacterales bacterium]